MNSVEPIRDRRKIAQIKNLLRGQCRYRDLLLFVMGINTALRVPDLLQLQIGHFLDEQHHMKRRFWIIEQKREKRHEIIVKVSMQAALDQYPAAYPGIQRRRPFSVLQYKNAGLFEMHSTRTGLEVHHECSPRNRSPRPFLKPQPAENLGVSCAAARG